MKTMKQRNIFIGVVGVVLIFLGWTYIDYRNSQDHEIIELEEIIAEHEETIKKYEDIIVTSSSDLESLQNELRDVEAVSSKLNLYRLDFVLVESKSEVESLAYDLSNDVDDLQREIQEVESIADDVQYKLQNTDDLASAPLDTNDL